ncbi:hypothetical protein [Terasakiella sp. SH-1]|uniref:hypothetical protein n=1 Tax=Terasakiella sp. SH-1 TaxID=2560057 RepID=UPI001073534F|nr:hypothetical protein [Terasakiella sp. SH-1]
MFITIKTAEKEYLVNPQDISYIEPVATAVFTGVRVFLRSKKPGSDYPVCFEALCSLDEIYRELEYAKK